MIVDEVFLDYELTGSAQPKLCGQSGSANVYAERAVEGFGAAADEGGVGGDQRAARIGIRRQWSAGGHCRYLSVDERPDSVGLPVLLAQRTDIQRQLMERVKENLAELDRQLAGQKACERLVVEGGWYAVLRVPVTSSDEELAIELVREKSGAGASRALF